jgi:hypothetical protein
VAKRICPGLITVCIHFDERVVRMGFGDLATAKSLRDLGIVVNSTPGLRTGRGPPGRRTQCGAVVEGSGAGSTGAALAGG